MAVAMQTPAANALGQFGELRVDRDFNVVGWNAGLEQMFGWTAIEAIGQHSTKVVPRAGDDEDRLAADRTELETTGTYQGLVAYRHRDGHVFTAYLSARRARGGYLCSLWVPNEFRKMDRDQAHEVDRQQVRQTFEQRLRAARDRRDEMTQAELASRVGVRPNEINRWEHASTWGVLPSPFYRRKLARALEIEDPLYLWPDVEVDDE